MKKNSNESNYNLSHIGFTFVHIIIMPTFCSITLKIHPVFKNYAQGEVYCTYKYKTPQVVKLYSNHALFFCTIQWIHAGLNLGNKAFVIFNSPKQKQHLCGVVCVLIQYKKLLIWKDGQW